MEVSYNNLGKCESELVKRNAVDSAQSREVLSNLSPPLDDSNKRQKGDFSLISPNLFSSVNNSQYTFLKNSLINLFDFTCSILNGDILRYSIIPEARNRGVLRLMYDQNTVLNVAPLINNDMSDELKQACVNQIVGKIYNALIGSSVRDDESLIEEQKLKDIFRTDLELDFFFMNYRTNTVYFSGSPYIGSDLRADFLQPFFDLYIVPQNLNQDEIDMMIVECATQPKLKKKNKNVNMTSGQVIFGQFQKPRRNENAYDKHLTQEGMHTTKNPISYTNSEGILITEILKKGDILFWVDDEIKLFRLTDDINEFIVQTIYTPKKVPTIYDKVSTIKQQGDSDVTEKLTALLNLAHPNDLDMKRLFSEDAMAVEQPNQNLALLPDSVSSETQNQSMVLDNASKHDDQSNMNPTQRNLGSSHDSEDVELLDQEIVLNKDRCDFDEDRGILKYILQSGLSFEICSEGRVVQLNSYNLNQAQEILYFLLDFTHSNPVVKQRNALCINFLVTELSFSESDSNLLKILDDLKFLYRTFKVKYESFKVYCTVKKLSHSVSLEERFDYFFNQYDDFQSLDLMDQIKYYQNATQFFMETPSTEGSDPMVQDSSLANDDMDVKLNLVPLNYYHTHSVTFKNHGATCWVSSALVELVHTDIFDGYLDSIDQSLLVSPTKKTFYSALINLINYARTASDLIDEYTKAFIDAFVACEPEIPDTLTQAPFRVKNFGDQVGTFFEKLIQIFDSATTYEFEQVKIISGYVDRTDENTFYWQNAMSQDILKEFSNAGSIGFLSVFCV